MNDISVFIASTQESFQIATIIANNIKSKNVVPEIWSEQFQPSDDAMEALTRVLNKSSFGIFVFDHKDLLIFRDEECRVTRDNVVFEFGMFVGALGKQRCFIITPKSAKDFHYPSDLIGLTKVFFDDINISIDEAVSVACKTISKRITELGHKERRNVNIENILVTYNQQGLEGMSTGAALGFICDTLTDAMKKGLINGIQDTLHDAQQIASYLRRNMLNVRHFLRIGPGYPIQHWSYSNDILSCYFDQLLNEYSEALSAIGIRLGMILQDIDTVCISEFSRAVFQGLKVRMKTGRPLKAYLVDRENLAEVRTEVENFEDSLKSIGIEIIDRLQISQWLELLRKMDSEAKNPFEVILFGAEAVMCTGEILFPQIIKTEEQDLIMQMKKNKLNEFNIYCVAESYKYVPPIAAEDASKLTISGHYTLIPSAIFDYYVTDKSRISNADIRSSRVHELFTDRTREIMSDLLSNERLIPFSLSSNSELDDVTILALDIDDTITINGKITIQIQESINRLSEQGYKIVLITGRSSGWSQAIISYIAGIDYIISENGNILMNNIGEIEYLCDDLHELVKDTAETLKEKYSLTLTNDSYFRLSEVSFQVPKGMDYNILNEINCQIDSKIEAIASSIHIHIRPKGFDKATSLKYLIDKYTSATPDQVLVVGDSPTDISLFKSYPLSIGVDNIVNFLSELGEYKPKYKTSNKEGKGFIEVAQRLLSI